MPDTVTTTTPEVKTGDTTTTVDTTTTSKPWFEGKLDAESVGWLQNRGLATKAPEDVAIAAIAGHREAERLIGLPADRLLKLPTDPNDANGWSQVWSRLGAPADAKGYGYEGLKYADGSEIEPEFKDALSQAFADNHVPVAAAQRIASSLVKFMDSVDKNDADTTAANLAVERDALAKNWGPNAEANKFIARQAATKLGFTPEQVEGLEKTVGYAKTMEALRAIGVALGEDRYIAGEGDTRGRVMTVEQAKAKRAELSRDPAWVNRYNSGGQPEFREMMALNTLIANAEG